MLLLLDVEDLSEALQAPETFLKDLDQRRAGAVAEAWALAHLRPKLEPLLPPGVTWASVAVAVRQTSLVELRQGLLEPGWFLEQLATRLRPLALRLLVARAWPRLKQLLGRKLKRMQERMGLQVRGRGGES